MATSSAKAVDGSLWWDSFVHLFEELDAAPLSSDLSEDLMKKIKGNRAWFLDTVDRFKPPNEESRLALDSTQISLGSHRLTIKPELKEAALRASKCLWLDEVQSYVLVNRSFELRKSSPDVESQEFLHMVLLQYYLERQCLLKCVRRIYVHALFVNDESSSDAIKIEALQLVNDGIEGKLICTLQVLLSSIPSEKAEFDFTVLWVEESLIENNLVLDILFLFYYDNFCSCSVEHWKTMCSLFMELLSNSFNIGKLAISVEARNSFGHAKAQLLLVLIEALDLENLLRMVHDEVPFRQGYSSFALSDIQEIDAAISSFLDLGAVEAGPLILAWAVFVCLLLSLPDRSDYNTLMEIDHVGYVRQAFEVTPFNYLLDVLHSDSLRNSDGPISGFLSVLRTLISAFIASYDLTHETDNNTLDLILDIIYQIYHGEEALCIQFWDKESFVDSPIRSILSMLEREFPFHTAGFLRLLSSLCEGTWPAECVYNFLDKMSGITLPFELPGGSHVLNIYDIVETGHPLPIPGVEGLVIPSGSRGHVVKVIDADLSLVHWACENSGIFLLLMHMAQDPHRNGYEEIVLIVNLIHRMVSSNEGLCFPLLHIDNSLHVQAARRSGQLEKNVRVDVVKIICTLVFNFVQDARNVGVVSVCISILAKLLKCEPSHVIDVALRSNLFRTRVSSSSNGSWLLSGELARMLLIDSGGEVKGYPLTTSVLEFTVQLVEKGADNDMASALVVFSLQYVFVHHLNWTYKLKEDRWKVTLKAVEVVRSCIKAILVRNKLGSMLRDILYYDTSIHNILCRIISIPTQVLRRSYATHHLEFKETESLHLAVCLTLEAINSFLDLLSKEAFSNAPTFVQTLLSSATKPVPFVAGTVSLISSHNPALQVSAVRVLSMLCNIASRIQPYSVEKVSLLGEAEQIRELRSSIYAILDDEEKRNEDVLIPAFEFLASAARYQPALLICMLLTEEDGALTNISGDLTTHLSVASVDRPSDSEKARYIDSIMKHLMRSKILVKSAPRVLQSILDFLRALWEGGAQYLKILEIFRRSDMFWKNLSSILATEAECEISVKDMDDSKIKCAGYRYQCNATVIDIMAREIFLQEKLLQDETFTKQNTVCLNGNTENRPNIDMSKDPNLLHFKDIFSTWCGTASLGNHIKSYSSGIYDNDAIRHAEIAACLCMVHLVGKLSTGNAGSLSKSLVEKIHDISNKLNEHHAFAALIVQYLSHGYSEGKELTNLIFSDLYYHLQGELEGREISPGHFQELSHFLHDLRIFRCDERNYEREAWPSLRYDRMFDIPRLQEELGIDQWDYSDWKSSKKVADITFMHMHAANFTIFLTHSQCVALKALISMVSLFEGNIPVIKSLFGTEISDSLTESSIENVSKCLTATVDSFLPALNPSTDLLRLATSQAELLLRLSRILFRKHSMKTNRRKFLPLMALLIKTSAFCIRFLADIRPSTTVVDLALKHLLMLHLASVKFCFPVVHVQDKSDSELQLFSGASLTCMGLLPVLCKCTERTEISDLSVASIDLMLKSILAPNDWLPILQKHLPSQLVVRKIEQNDSEASLNILLNFLLSLARVKAGAEMLLSVNIFASLKVLFSNLSDDKHQSNNMDESCFYPVSINDEMHEKHLGLGLAVVTSMINSLGDDFSCIDIVDNAICYFFYEKANIMSNYLSPPTFPEEDLSKKRPRSPKVQTSLASLTITEQVLVLLCVLARHQASWSKGIKEMDSELREACIHLLAFISRGIHRIGESTNRTVHPFCPPTLKDEIDLNGKPPQFNCKHGWFVLSSRGIGVKTKDSATSGAGFSLVGKDQPNKNADLVVQSFFSETVAIQMYRIAFLVLKFLCMQAKEAARRAEELEFIDLAHFPELPVPEILYGLQDQAIIIVTELCEANKSKPMGVETEEVCLLLLQILEKSLYLELCVSQACGIRSVLGRIEDFSKEIKLLLQAVERHSSLRGVVKSLRQIVDLMYPGLMQTN